MIEEGDILYCKKDFILMDGDVNFTSGKFYEVTEVDENGGITMINDYGEFHYLENDDSEDGYKDFFTLREVNLKKLLDD